MARGKRRGQPSFFFSLLFPTLLFFLLFFPTHCDRSGLITAVSERLPLCYICIKHRPSVCLKKAIKHEHNKTSEMRFFGLSEHPKTLWKLFKIKTNNKTPHISEYPLNTTPPGVCEKEDSLNCVILLWLPLGNSATVWNDSDCLIESSFWAVEWQWDKNENIGLKW